MLTATYTLVALSVEQTSVKLSIQSLQKVLRTSLERQAALTQGQVDYACDALKRLYESCHWRKLDKFLVPAVRRATRAADALLQDLDELSQRAADAMASALRSVAGALPDSGEWVAQFRAAVDEFCAVLLKRLEREEHELFPMAQAAISGEEWFAIANQMLAHDSYQLESRGWQQDFRTGRGGFRARVELPKRQDLPTPLVH
jgi:hemerythrin-like domain-containing protein